MMTPQIIGNIRGFLSRATLRGEEVPAFNQVMTALAMEENEINMREQMQKAAARKDDLSSLREDKAL
jgi:hypothetical protein